jgi:hypothetical protein
MSLSTVDVEPDQPDAAGLVDTRRKTNRPVVGVVALVVLLIVGSIAASHYQPIEVDGGWAAGHPITTHVDETTQEWLLRNTGPLGVTVVALKSGEYDGPNSRSRIAPLKICPISTPRGDCGQYKTTGLIDGKAFHPFSLTTDTNRGVVLQYDTHCVTTSPGTPSGTVTFPVTYRFLWFTHTIVLTLPANDTFACPEG